MPSPSSAAFASTARTTAREGRQRVADPFFDTNILVDWLCDRPQAVAELSRYRAHRISRIVWTELLAGERLERRPALQTLLTAFTVVDIDARIAAAAADLNARIGMALMDAYVLATAQVSGAILITRNTKDFPAEMPGIRIPYTL